MTLDQLNYLLVLAEEQNVTRAAQRLYITQPTLTTFLNKLERELGTRLFDRSRNPVRPTKNGDLYLKRMRELLLAEQQLKEELRYQDSGRRRIRIGLGYTHSAMWAAILAEKLLMAFPELDLCFNEGQEADMLSSLRAGEIDLFLGHTEIDSGSFRFDVLFDEHIVLLLPLCFFLCTPAETSPDAPLLIEADVLAGKRMIVPGGSMGLNLNVQLLWKRYGVFPPAVLQTNNMISGVQMVGRGLGYMLGNEELLQFLPPERRSEIVFCTLPGMSQNRKYYYGYADNNPNLDLILETVRIMKEIIAVKL